MMNSNGHLEELAAVFRHYDALSDSDPDKHDFYAFVYMKLSQNASRRAAQLRDVAAGRRSRRRGPWV